MFKLSLYLDSLRQLETQFEFLHYACERLSKTGAKEFFAAKRKLEQSKVEANIDRASQAGVGKEFVEMARHHNKRTLLRKWGSEKRDLYLKEYIPDDLNKSELLLSTAIFEGYLKEFYRELVKVEPRRAFAKSEKPINFREITVENATEWAAKLFDTVVNQEAERFDHTPFEKRMKFLFEAYDLKIGNSKIGMANNLIERRHMISHRWVDRDVVKHVSPQELESGHEVFRSMIEDLFKQVSARKAYSKNFIR